MDSFSKFLLFTIIFFFICNIIFIIVKYILLSTLEKKEDLNIYNKIITKNYLKNNSDEEFYKKTLEYFEEKEKETCKFIKDKTCLEQIKLENELYENYLKFKQI